MLVSQEYYEITSSIPASNPSALPPAAFRAAFSLEHHHDEYRSSQGCGRALLGKYAHAGRTHPDFLHGTALRLCVQPRY
jgi:hypothetical protein